MFFFIQNGHSIHFKLLAPTDQDLNQLKNHWIFIITTSVAAAINRSVLITVVLLKLVSHDKRLTWCWSEQDHDSFGIPMSLDDSSLRCTIYASEDVDQNLSLFGCRLLQRMVDGPTIVLFIAMRLVLCLWILLYSLWYPPTLMVL